MSYEWITDAKEMASDAFSAVGEYMSENEWAANALTGAAVGGANYLMQKDKQKAERRATDKAWDRKVSLAKAPNIDKSQYDWSDLANGSLTNGGLISSAQG